MEKESKIDRVLEYAREHGVHQTSSGAGDLVESVKR